MVLAKFTSQYVASDNAMKWLMYVFGCESISYSVLGNLREHLSSSLNFAAGILLHFIAVAREKKLGCTWSNVSR